MTAAEEKEAMRRQRESDSPENNDDTQDTTMTDETDTTEASGIEAEINTIRGDGALENLSIKHTGGNGWAVLSARNGSVDVYQVGLGGQTCTCEHSENNDGSEACAHIVAVMLRGERTVSENAYEVQRIHSAIDRINDVTHDVADLHEAMDKKRIEQLSPSADDGGSTKTAPPAEPEEMDSANGEEIRNAPNVEEEAEKLKAAFDEVVDDMQVETNGGLIWFQTGRDTEDTLPGPGNVQVFDALIKNPSQTEYVHDDHENVSKKPGEWYKTCITPSQVDEYISEVLE